MFSIVIPLYNKEKWVTACINSILNQHFTDFELIIVDDGSTDKSLELVKNQFNDERIKIIRQKNAGVSVARNTGIAHASYKYIAFMDADDYWHPDYLKLNCDALLQNPKIDIIGSNYINKIPLGHSFDKQENKVD